MKSLLQFRRTQLSSQNASRFVPCGRANQLNRPQFLLSSNSNSISFATRNPLGINAIKVRQNSDDIQDRPTSIGPDPFFKSTNDEEVYIEEEGEEGEFELSEDNLEELMNPEPRKLTKRELNIRERYFQVRGLEPEHFEEVTVPYEPLPPHIDQPDIKLGSNTNYESGLRLEGMLDQLGRTEKSSFDERFVNVVESELRNRHLHSRQQVPFSQDADKRARAAETIALYAENPEKYPEITTKELEILREFSGMSPNHLHFLVTPKPPPKPVSVQQSDLLYRRFERERTKTIYRIMKEQARKEETITADNQILQDTAHMWAPFNTNLQKAINSKRKKKYEIFREKVVKYNQEKLALEALKPKTPEKLKEEAMIQKFNPKGLPAHRLNGFGVYFPTVLGDYPRDHSTWPTINNYARVLSKNPTYTQEEKEQFMKQFKRRLLTVNVELLKRNYRKIGIDDTLEYPFYEDDIKDEEVLERLEMYQEQMQNDYIKRIYGAEFLERYHASFQNFLSPATITKMQRNAHSSDDE